MIQKVMENRRTVVESKSKEHDQAQTAHVVDFLLRSRYSGLFYRAGSASYLIPIQYSLGYRVAPLRMN